MSPESSVMQGRNSRIPEPVALIPVLILTTADGMKPIITVAQQPHDLHWLCFYPVVVDTHHWLTLLPLAQGVQGETPRALK